MRSAPALSGLSLAALAGCVLFHDEPTGGAGGEGGTGAAGASQVMSSGGSGGVGAGPIGGGGSGAGTPCTEGVLGDAQNCGACDHACGGRAACVSGVCEPEWMPLDEGVFHHSIVVGAGDVVLAVGEEFRVTGLRSVSFDLAPVNDAETPQEMGIGFLGRGQGGEIFYAVQVRDDNGAPRMLRCDPGLSCAVFDLSAIANVSDRHVNGAVWRGNNFDLVLDTPPRLMRVTSCTNPMGAGGTCTLELTSGTMVASMGAIVQNPAGLALQSQPEETLWWLGYRGVGNDDCLAQLRVDDLDPGTAPVCDPIAGQNNRVFARGPHVYVAPLAPGGVVQRVVTAGPPVDVDVVGGVASPIATDQSFLFGAAVTSGEPAVVVRPLAASTNAAERVNLSALEILKLIDASHPTHVFFVTTETNNASPRLYRWRKPPQPGG